MQEREREEAKERAKEHEAQRAAEARRRETLRIVESTVKAEVAERRNKDSDPLGESIEPFKPVNLKFWLLPSRCVNNPRFFEGNFKEFRKQFTNQGLGPLKAAPSAQPKPSRVRDKEVAERNVRESVSNPTRKDPIPGGQINCFFK